MVSVINLSTKWAYNPLFTDQLANFPVEIHLHIQKSFVFETQYFSPKGMSRPFLQTRYSNGSALLGGYPHIRPLI